MIISQKMFKNDRQKHFINGLWGLYGWLIFCWGVLIAVFCRNGDYNRKNLYPALDYNRDFLY